MRLCLKFIFEKFGIDVGGNIEINESGVYSYTFHLSSINDIFRTPTTSEIEETIQIIYDNFDNAINEFECDANESANSDGSDDKLIDRGSCDSNCHENSSGSNESNVNTENNHKLANDENEISNANDILLNNESNNGKVNNSSLDGEDINVKNEVITDRENNHIYINSENIRASKGCFWDGINVSDISTNNGTNNYSES